MRVFLLLRDADLSGVSGTGIVAEGVEFSDGTAILRWLRKPFGLSVYRCVDDLLDVHGHNGTSRILWIGGNHDNDERRSSDVESIRHP